jgi:phosphate transport system substrate-binding protein
MRICKLLTLGAVLTSLSLTASADDKKLTGSVKSDGSSTVFPVAEAVAEEFQLTHPRSRITVGLSGTGGGFKKFAAGETDISNASREMRDSEKKLAAKNNIEFIEIPVAFDGLSVMVNPKNQFVDSLSLAQLKKAWQPKSSVKTWQDLNAKWPKEEIKFYGPGADSGTFDYFTEAVMGEARASRPDYVASEDDNVLVRGIANDPNALGYFGFAYYVENKDKLKLLSIAAEGKEPVKPTPETIESGKYPLARPLLIYVNLEAARKKPVVKEYIEFFLKNAATLSKEVGYVPLPQKRYDKVLAEFRQAVAKTKQSH